MALRAIGRTNYELVNEWLDSLFCNQASKEEYRRIIRRWFNFLAIRKYDADAPVEEYVIEFRNSLSKHSPYYVNNVVNRVRQFYRWCFQMGYWTVPVGDTVRSYKLHFKYNKLPLAESQIKQLLTSVANPQTPKDYRDAVIVYLMMFNGLRCVEISRMTFADIEKYGEYSVIRIQPKGHRQKDELRRLPDLTLSAIEDYTSILAEKYDDVASLPIAMSYHRRLFGKPQPLIPSVIGWLVKRKLSAIGINSEKITPHSLRHSYACLMLESGVSLEEVQAQMGHSSPQQTELYSAMVIDKKKLESGAINAIIEKLKQ